jgi:hypothetical protein
MILLEPADPSKAETLRRLRLGDLKRLFRHRWGPELPDDDAGREDLRELLLAISLGQHAEIKMPKAIEVWAPWMPPNEATLLIDNVNRTPIWHRKPNAKRLGFRQRVTNQTREYLKLRTISPCDMTDEQMREQRRAKDRERKRRLRAKCGSRPRVEYESNSISRTKPWEAAGFKCRRTWERHGKPSPKVDDWRRNAKTPVERLDPGAA